MGSKSIGEFNQRNGVEWYWCGGVLSLGGYCQRGGTGVGGYRGGGVLSGGVSGGGRIGVGGYCLEGYCRGTIYLERTSHC